MDNLYSKSHWNPDNRGTLTESAICLPRRAARKARVSKYTYDSGTESVVRQ